MKLTLVQNSQSNIPQLFCYKGFQTTYLPDFILGSVLLLMFLLINLIPEVGHEQKILVIFCLLNSSKTINSLSICYTWDSTESIIVIRVLEKRGSSFIKSWQAELRYNPYIQDIISKLGHNLICNI